VYSAIAVIWITIPTFTTLMGCMSTDIIKETCVSWGAFSSYADEKAITSSLLLFTYLLPMTSMVFCYARVIHTLKTKVTSTLNKGKTSLI